VINNLKVGLKIRITDLLKKQLKPILNLLGMMKEIELILLIEFLLFVEDVIEEFL